MPLPLALRIRCVILSDRADECAVAAAGGDAGDKEAESAARASDEVSFNADNSPIPLPLTFFPTGDSLLDLRCILFNLALPVHTGS